MGRGSPQVALGVLWVAAVVLAGCSSKPASVGSVVIDDFDAETGAIAGTILDDEFQVVEGVDVGIPALNLTAVTDVAGLFVLRAVPPGTHDVYASKFGYEAKAVRAQVQVGQALELQIILNPLGTNEPYLKTQDQKGIFGCGFAVRTLPVPPVPGALPNGFRGIALAACGLLNGMPAAEPYDKFLLGWTVPGPISGWDGAVVEMEWRSNQALGTGLSFVWEVSGCPNVGATSFGGSAGKSPLWKHINETRIDQILENASKKEPPCNEAPKSCHEKQCKIMSRVFPVSETLGGGSETDVGVTFQQPYGQYLTTFHHQPAPAEFRFLK